jgi:hypothetical protein
MRSHAEARPPMRSHAEARPRRWRLAGAVAVLAAMAAVVVLVLQARAGAQSASSSSLLASRAADVAQDLREAEDTARMSPEELGREAGRAPPRRAPAAQPLFEPVHDMSANAVDAERRVRLMRKAAEAGLTARRSLVKAFQAQRRVSQVQFNAALDAEEAKHERAAVWSPPQTQIDGFGHTWSLPQTTAHTAAALTDPDTVSEDQKLRASNELLYADAVSAPPGALARAKWLSAAQQKKEKPASDRLATELAGVQKEVESLKPLLAKAELAKTPPPPPEHERLSADDFDKAVASFEAQHAMQTSLKAAQMQSQMESFMQEIAQQEELAAVQSEMESFKHELAQVFARLHLPILLYRLHR